MQIYPIIPLCDVHTEELKQHIDQVPDSVELTQAERVMRSCCDAGRSCDKANHWFHLSMIFQPFTARVSGGVCYQCKRSIPLGEICADSRVLLSDLQRQQ